MLIISSLLAMLFVGIAVGLAWRGLIVIGDRRALDRLAAQLETERRMAAATNASLRTMRQVVRESWRDGARR